MPPALLFNLSRLDLDAKPVFDRQAICAVNPQQYEMQQLDGILWIDEAAHHILGYKDVTDNEFWIRGHIPGRPLMPGVIMIEAAAQLLSFYVKQIVGIEGFVGFAGINSAKFRATVEVGSRLYLLGHGIEIRSRKHTFMAQGVVNGKLAFETCIEGIKV